MAGIPDNGNSAAAGHRLIIWCVPRSGSTALLKCLSFLPEHPTTKDSNDLATCSYEKDDDLRTVTTTENGAEVWFEPYNMSRYVRMASRKVHNEELPTELDGNEDKYYRALKAVELMLPLVPGGLKNPNPYLISLKGIQQTLENSQSKIVVVKDMASGIHGHFNFIPAGFRHVFLIRDPRQVFPSLRKLFVGFLKLDEEAMSKADIQKFHPFYAAHHWFGELYDLWKHVRSTFDPNPLILDTADLLRHPESCLRKICEAIGVGYQEGLLEWSASVDVVGRWKNGVSESLSADNVLETMGMKRAFESSRFVPPAATQPPSAPSTLTQDCIRITKECDGWYNEMYEHRFVPK
ncbi:uncharacterized protein LOC121414458 [Lytechinus variegatus]|uniref:uncharacterized protein LOC121414410 n=1 Tax=Lytechinus variegatus TaxID=7654 RepID=UPI001BB1E26D|nr:uncharacterized protein LOC121414410 [Lytechinus variegatus]XP_041463574.1 uncharacterized protein LOC121414458 [Lytechinus variegatus]